MRTRQIIEQALDAGKLHTVMTNGRVWRCRRNGKTQTWKRDPERFRIPVKAGLRSCGELTNQNMHEPYWVIKE